MGIFHLCTLPRLKAFRGTQRIVSVNYLFGRLLIPYDILKRIVTSKFRNMRNLMSVFFRVVKNVVLATEEKVSYNFRKGDKT